MINKIAYFNVFVFIIILLLNWNDVNAQFENYPELDWYTIETEHFTITYHTEASRTAKTIAKIAEDVYGPITSLYQYEPGDKVNFIVKDVSDVANGATDFYNNRIEILATPLD